jgi:hypothetical protein
VFRNTVYRQEELGVLRKPTSIFEKLDESVIEEEYARLEG